jgi:hypothetical protein
MAVAEREVRRAEPGERQKLGVFISYSRSDMAFADELAAGLEYDGGFEVAIDRNDIHEGENWRQRLGALIAAADTVVFIISPKSATSPVCQWEVEEAARLSKRILPVQAKPLEGTSPPRQLSQLNYVRFDPMDDGRPRSFVAGLAALRRALNSDLDWLREHTRLLVRAQEWQAAGKPLNRLLSGSDVAAARAWLERKPKEAPAPTELHLDFISASEQAETERVKTERERAERLQRAVTWMRWALGGAVTLAILATGAGVLASRSQQEATLRQQEAMLRQKEAQAAQRELASKVAELERQEKELRSYYQQARDAVRSNAELKFKEIMRKQIRPAPALAKPARASTTDEILARLTERTISAIIAFELGRADGASGTLVNGVRVLPPVWPGAESGVTIGIGFDLGYRTRDELSKAWAELPTETLDRLADAIGVRGQKARELTAKLADVAVPFDLSVRVFRTFDLVRYARLLERELPEARDLPPDAYGALVSLVHNRGAAGFKALKHDNRKEMYAIGKLVEIGAYDGVPEQFRAMKWVWERDLRGLHRRREAEARLFEAGLATVAAAKAKKVP